VHPKRSVGRNPGATCKVIRTGLTKGYAPDEVFTSGIFISGCIQMPLDNEYQETLD
jgi:hypothetical protein